jgi:hypothetical protein
MLAFCLGRRASLWDQAHLETRIPRTTLAASASEALTQRHVTQHKRLLAAIAISLTDPATEVLSGPQLQRNTARAVEAS